MKKLLVLALFLRLLLGAFYFHPDIKTINFQVSFMKKGVIDIYTYLSKNKGSLPIKDEFIYFPLSYITLGAYQTLATPFLGHGFDIWLNDARAAAAENPRIYWYLLVLKLPFLAADIGIGFLLMKFFADKQLGEKAFLLWLFNPFSLIFIYVFSNVDIFAMFFVLLSFLFAKRGKLVFASGLLGIAAGFKLFPILFLPFVFLAGRGLREKLLILAAPLLTLVLTVMPFMSGAFVQAAFVSGLTTRIFYPNLAIGFSESIIAGIVGMTVLFFYAALFDKKLSLPNYWTGLFLILFSFTHFHVQWLLWLAPFFVILVTQRPKLTWVIAAISLFASAIPFLYDDRSMTVGLLRAYSLLFDLTPTVFTAVQKVYDPYGVQSMLHSGLAGVSLVFLAKIFKEER